MTSSKIFYANALGWRSQAALLERAIRSQFPESGVTCTPYNLPRGLRPLLKDIYGLSFPRRLNLISSIDVTASAYGRHLVGIAKPDGAILLGGSTAGLIHHMPKGTKVAVVTDMTHALANRLFHARFGNRDTERERDCLSQCSKVFAMSTACLESLSEDYGLPGDSLELLLPPTELIKTSRRSDAELPVIGFVGGDFRRKGGHDLVSVFKEALADIAELKIVSAFYQERASPRISHFASLPHKVIVEEFMPGLDIFCLPTYRDCSGNAIAEALSAGIPVVATRIPGVHDLVTNEKTGLLISPGNREELKRALTRLVLDKEFRTRCAVEASAFAIDNLDLQKAARRLVGAIT